MKFCYTIIMLLLPILLQAQEKKPVPLIEEIKLYRKEPIDYVRDIEPIFKNKCMFCHSDNVIEGKFDMSTHEKVMKGGKRGAVVVAGNVDKSILYGFSSRKVKPIMPPKSEEPLSPQELALVKRWIEEGAKGPAAGAEKTRVKIALSLPPAIVKPVRGVAISQDKKVVAASRGNQIFLFDVEKGTILKKLVDTNIKLPNGTPAEAAHVSIVESLAISPDGKELISGSFQEIIRWDLATGTLKQRITDFADRITMIAYSPDGSKFATAGGAPTQDGELRIYERGEGKLLVDIKPSHSDTVFGVSFSPDGSKLASCGADKFVKIFEVPSGKFIKSFEGHTHHVMDVGWKADGKFLASAGADNNVKVWDYEKGEQSRTINAHKMQVTRLVFVGKNPSFLTASGDKQVRMWNVENGGNMRNYQGFEDFIYALAVSEDGKLVAAGGEEGTVKLFNGDNSQLLKTLTPVPQPEKKK